MAGAWAVFKSRFFSASVPQVLSAFTATGQSVSDVRNGLIKPRLRLDAAMGGAALGEQYTSGTTLTLTPIAKQNCRKVRSAPLLLELKCEPILSLGSTGTTWIYGLQQNALNRSNLALVNAGEVDATPSSLAVDLFDGFSGAKVGSFAVTLNAREWKQIGAVLAQHAPDTLQGYARITRTSGNNPFLAYAVVNDGGQPGQRTGDGAFILVQP